MNSRENKEAAQILETGYRLDWNKWDALIFVILAPFTILTTLVILAPTQAIDFLSGRFGFSLDFFGKLSHFC